MYYYQSIRDDSAVESKLREYAQNRVLSNRGCGEYYKRIRKEGIIWNHKRVERVYKKLGMNRKRKIKRRIPNPEKKVLLQPLEKNLTWSMDFMEDRLENGRKVRVLNILDDYNREAIEIKVEHSFPSNRVVDILCQTIEWRGKPKNIRTDNGTEFIAKAFEGFCMNSGIEHLRIQKGKPNQNGYVERFNRSYREGVLDAYIFETMDQVRSETAL
jgi:putative transposase